MPTSSRVSLSMALQRGLTAQAHRLSPGEQVFLSGKTFDLKSAYKQLPIHKDDLRFAQATVWNADRKSQAVLALKALPFGATGSVQGFCRCSLALWALVLCYIVVPSTVFFDDYTSIVAMQDAESAESAFILLMRILGWKVASDKSKPFAHLFQSLGICFLLPRSLTDPVQVSNTEQRRREVAATCLRILRLRKASPHECSVFAGRLRWLEGQTFGRLGRKAFRTILQSGDPPVTSGQNLSHCPCKRQLSGYCIMSPRHPPSVFTNLLASAFSCSLTGRLKGARDAWQGYSATKTASPGNSGGATFRACLCKSGLRMG